MPRFRRPPTSPRMHQRPQNYLLELLSAEDRVRLAPQLRTIHLNRNQIHQSAGDAIPTIYFPTTAVLALVSILHDGHMTGLGTIGQNGMAGIPLLLGASASPYAMLVQSAGSAQVLRAELFRDEIGLHGLLDRLLLLYTQTFLNQVSQMVACNTHHPLRGRTAVWLLRMRDGRGTDDVSITQEFLALMLGVGRPSVTVAAQELANQGLIRYRRGVVTIIDSAGLEAIACECYRLIREEDARLEALMRAVPMWRG